MVIIGTVGVQREKSDVHHVDIPTMAAIGAPEDASMSDDDDGEEEANMALLQLSGVDPAGSHHSCKLHCGSGMGGVDPAVASALVGAKAPDHRLTHKPTDPACDACIRGKMKNLRKHAGAFRRPLTQFGDSSTMDQCSF